jgi:hypothetical protein
LAFPFRFSKFDVAARDLIDTRLEAFASAYAGRPFEAQGKSKSRPYKRRRDSRDAAQTSPVPTTTSAFRPEAVLPELPVSLQAQPLVPLADAKGPPVLERASLGRHGCPRWSVGERPPDEEPGSQRRFPRTEAARCYAPA